MRTEIYGLDLYWKWKLQPDSGFPFVSWQTEALYQRFEAGRTLLLAAAETLKIGLLLAGVVGLQTTLGRGSAGEYAAGNHGWTIQRRVPRRAHSRLPA